MTDDQAENPRPDQSLPAGKSSEVEKSAWQRTLTDMDEMEAALRAEGWDVLAVAADQTATANQDAGETDFWGLVHVVPDNFSDEISARVDESAFPQYRVFRREMGGRLFMLTQYTDPETEQVLLIASNFELRHAPGLVETALDKGYIKTHIQTLNGTVLGTFRHEDVEKFFPDPEAVINRSKRPSEVETDR